MILLAEFDKLVRQISDLVKKAENFTKINETGKRITDHDHGENITTQKLDKLTVDDFAARLKQGNLSRKNDITNFVKKQILMKI